MFQVAFRRPRLPAGSERHPITSTHSTRPPVVRRVAAFALGVVECAGLFGEVLELFGCGPLLVGEVPDTAPALVAGVVVECVPEPVVGEWPALSELPVPAGVVGWPAAPALAAAEVDGCETAVVP